MQQVLVAWAMGAPIIFAICAGRASQNLIDTEIWHKWTFRFFVCGTVALIACWFMTSYEIMCAEKDLEWHKAWRKHVQRFHSQG